MRPRSLREFGDTLSLTLADGLRQQALVRGYETGLTVSHPARRMA